VKDALQQIFDSVPEDEPRSRLEPYRELILQWRRQGRSYRGIQKLLSDKCQITIAYEPLRRFVKRRSRPRKPQIETVTDLPAMTSPPEPGHPAKPNLPVSAEEKAAQIEFIRGLNTPVIEEQPKPRWTFDPEKPRTNHKQ
jgi:hypothetical protein